jgi:Ca2+-binding EF-hand superfamily protein
MKTLMTIALCTLMLAGCGQAPLLSAPKVAGTGLSTAQGLSFGKDRELKRIFAAIDANGNGKITYQEAIAAPTGGPLGGYIGGEKEQQARAFIERHDQNRDGQISFKEYKAAQVGQPYNPNQPSAEMMARIREIFNLVDASQDGLATLDELLAAPTGQPAGGYTPGQKEQEAEAFMARYDANKDGAISFEEFLAVHVGHPGPAGKSSK